MTVACLRSVTGFVELQIADDTEICRVDLAYDARIRPPERTPFTTVLALEELAADKVLALLARAQARDFLDALRAFDRLTPDEFELDIAIYKRLQGQVHGWRHDLERELYRGRRTEHNP